MKLGQVKEVSSEPTADEVHHLSIAQLQMIFYLRLRRDVLFIIKDNILLINFTFIPITYRCSPRL